jgi:hypothetical protein
VATVAQAVAPYNNTSASDPVSGSFTPTAGDLLVVMASGSATANEGTATASANGITFTRVESNIWGGNDWMSIFVADQLVPSSPSAMTITVSYGADPVGGAHVHYYRVSGMPSGNVGSAAVRQTAADFANTVVAPTVTLASACLTGNPVLSLMVNSSNPSGVTNGPSGWTTTADAGHGSPSMGARSAYVSSGFTGSTVTWGSNSATAWGCMAIELDAASAVTPTLSVAPWVGAVTTSAATVVGKFADLGGVNPQFRYSVNSDMSSATTMSAVTPDAQGVARFNVSGLAANTRYYYKFVVGSTVIDGGSFNTFPSTGSFTFGFASCRNSGNDTSVFGDLLTRDPNTLFFLEIGDLHYEDIGVEDSSLRRAAYDNWLSQTNIGTFMRTKPMPYIYDDHDSTGNNSWSGDTGWTSTTSVYRERVPHYTLPASDAAYFTFTAGRARFIVLDNRAHADAPAATDGPSKTRLGATQKAWLLDLLDTATEPLIFLVSSAPWIGTVAESGEDHWGMYPNERTDIANAIAANGRVVILSGDQHALAYDDGTNSPGGCPVWHAAPLYRGASTIKGGPYSGGTFPTTETSGVIQQYGFVEVTDNGTTITATYNGIKTDGSTWATTSFSPFTDVPATASLSAASTLTTSAPVRTQPAAASLSAASTLTTSAPVRTQPAAASLSATSTLTTSAPARTQAVSVSLSATSTLTTTAPARTQAVSASLSAASTLTTSAPARTQAVSASLSAASTLAADGAPQVLAAAALSAASTLVTSAPVRTQPTVAALSSTSTLTTSAPARTQAVSAVLGATSSLSAGALLIRVVAAALEGVSTLTVAAFAQRQAEVGLTATSSLAGTSDVGFPVAAALAASSNLEVSGYIGRQSAVSLAADGTLTISSIQGVASAAALTTEHTLQAGSFMATFVLVPLQAVASLSITGATGRFGAVAMTAVVTTSGVANVIIVGGDVDPRATARMRPNFSRGRIRENESDARLRNIWELV